MGLALIITITNIAKEMQNKLMTKLLVSNIGHSSLSNVSCTIEKLWIMKHIFTAHQRSCGKVIFLQVCVYTRGGAGYA